MDDVEKIKFMARNWNLTPQPSSSWPVDYIVPASVRERDTKKVK
jgi:hypothetical protein